MGITSTEKNSVLARRLTRATGLTVTEAHARTLRLAELALRRWSERECGDGSNWHIERDEKTGIPYAHYNGPNPLIKPYRIPDREAGAIKRVRAVAEHYNLHFYHQTDPRGCSLYISDEPLTSQTYYRGVRCGEE